jgi:hypothetical protein
LSSKTEGWPSEQEETWFRSGVTAEHDRIVTLLITKQLQYKKLALAADREGDDETFIFYEMAIKDLEELIELIKGEQNEKMD